jgi:hypothetical protein
VTDEPVTVGKVEGALNWLNVYREKSWRLNGKRCVACPDDGTFAESIGTGKFKHRSAE